MNGVEYIKGKYEKAMRDSYLGNLDLEVGEYLLFTEVDWRNNINDDSYTVTCYGQGEVTFEDVTSYNNKISVLEYTMRGLVAQKHPHICKF